MAVAFRSQNTNSTSSSTSFVITKPTGLAVNDVMVAFISYGFGGTVNTPSGWTALTAFRGSNIETKPFYKLADSTDVAATNFTWTSGAAINWTGGILAFSGASIPQPVFGSSSVINDSASPLTIPSMSVLANSIIVMGVNNDHTSTLSGYSIATDNPSWTEAWELVIGTQNTAVAYSTVRSASTDTGVGSMTNPATYSNAGGLMLSIPPNKTITQEDTVTHTDSLVNDLSIFPTDTITHTDELSATDSRIWTHKTKNTKSWTHKER